MWSVGSCRWGNGGHGSRAALPFVNGRNILEIGHGPGHLLLELSQQGKFVVGLDLSPYMGRMAQRTIAAERVCFRCWCRGKVQELAVENGRFRHHPLYISHRLRGAAGDVESSVSGVGGKRPFCYRP